MNPDARTLLRFAALFLWADLDVADAEQTFLHDLARELGAADPATVDALLAAPPSPEQVDPTRVSPALAQIVRDVALRAIAADGRVEPEEMALFDLLDELLPCDPRADDVGAAAE
jgi:hypothetical protein